jgi:hypothetical protein
MRRGLYRIHGVNGGPNDIRVDDDGIEGPVEEGLYRKRGYTPAVEELLWKDDYDRKRLPESDGSAKESADKFARETARRDFLAGLPKS